MSAELELALWDMRSRTLWSRWGQAPSDEVIRPDALRPRRSPQDTETPARPRPAPSVPI